MRGSLVGRETAEVPALKRQWQAGMPLQCQYLTDDDEMIAAEAQRMHAALKATQRIRYMRRRGIAAPSAIDFEFFARTAREVHGKIALLVRENVHGKWGTQRKRFDR